MKLASTAKVTVLGVEKKEASGEYGESFKIAIQQGAECGPMPCTKEVYESVKDKKMYEEYNIGLVSNEYNNKVTLRVVSISPAPVSNVTSGK